MPEARILVVDDNPTVLQSITLVLKHAGYDVATAQTGEEAVTRAHADVPDLILLDVVLPGIDGLEVCRRIKSNPELASTGVILISGAKTASESQAEGLELGADGYIARPISNRELIARVEAVLRLKEVDRKLKQHQQELEQLIEERTQTLKILRGATVDREVRMAELKDIITRLHAQLEAADVTPAVDDPRDM